MPNPAVEVVQKEIVGIVNSREKVELIRASSNLCFVRIEKGVC